MAVARRPRSVLSRVLVAASMALVWWAAAAAAKPGGRDARLLIVRANGGQLENVAARNGLVVVDRLECDPEGDDVALVLMTVAPGPPEHAAAALVAGDQAIKKAEPVSNALLPEAVADAAIAQPASAILDALAREGTAAVGAEADGSPRELWIGYADQPAARLVRLAQAQAQGIGSGSVIAIIDSAVDAQHPVLADRLIDGWDFVQESGGGASLRASVDQSTMAILDQSTMAILDLQTRAVVGSAGEVEALAPDDSTSVLVASGAADGLAGRLGTAFGHGTMVAGIAHLVAPGALIMPLRAFDDDGSAATFDVIQAIHYAVRHGATVINLSFSLDRESRELERAIEYAVRSGVICVASAGNDGSSVLVYPAALPDAIGVAATDLDDYVAPFSNFGNDLVKLAAPGVSVITTYPGGGWAAGSGTSFSTPWISGAVALLAERARHAGVALDLERALDALSHGATVHGVLAAEVGSGRLDAEQAGDHLSLAPAAGGKN